MSAASLEQIRVAIRDRMATVPDIGVIQPYERYAKAEAAFAALMMSADAGGVTRLLGWTIRRIATRETIHSSLKNRVDMDFQLRGFMGLEDARQTEILMDGLVEQLRTAWRRDPSFGDIFDAPIATGQPVGLQLVESQPYMFGGVLCHGVRLNFTGAMIVSAEDDPAEWDDFRIFHANWDVPQLGNVSRELPADATADATDHVILPLLEGPP